jgi:ATP-dependent protease ClpP protease subunit
MDYFGPEESFNLARDHGVFVVTKEISYGLVEDLCQGILSSIDDATEVVEVLISSPGGALAGATCFSEFTSLFEKIRIHGIAVGECGSAAFAMLQCCHKRIALPQCVFAIHYLHSGVPLTCDGTEQEQAKHIAADATRSQKLLDDLICGRSGISRREWKRLMKEGERYGVSLTAQEMLDCGLIDKIIKTFPLY